MFEEMWIKANWRCSYKHTCMKEGKERKDEKNLLQLFEIRGMIYWLSAFIFLSSCRRRRRFLLLPLKCLSLSLFFRARYFHHVYFMKRKIVWALAHIQHKYTYTSSECKTLCWFILTNAWHFQRNVSVCFCHESSCMKDLCNNFYQLLLFFFMLWTWKFLYWLN